MALVHFRHWHADEDKPHADADLIDYQGDALWLWKTHVGLCLKEREMNGYHDSDFYMTVWNEEAGKPEEICFASTRGWTYPSYGSNVDATPEVRAKYDAWLAAEHARWNKARRNTEAKDKRALHRALLGIAAADGVPIARLHKLRKLTTDGQPYLGLLTKKLRSKFKLSLRAQVLDWLKTEKPKYRTPLSVRQLEFLR